MKKIKFVLPLAVIAVFGTAFLLNARNSFQPTKKVEASEIPVFPVNYACYCEQQLNGCYVPAGVQIFCPNGAQASPTVLPNGFWCYDNIRSGNCQVPCMTRCIEP